MQVRPDQVRILITEHSAEHFAVGGITNGEKNLAASNKPV
jgi:hypothetical protein